jgi:tetraacyldisaccharide 4'-kinase
MRPYWHNLFRRLQGAADTGPLPNAGLTAAATVASRFYGLGAGLRRTFYAKGLLRTKKLPVPVISVGNLTVGGTGKTPMVACLAGLWRDRGQRVVILSRGYGGRTQNPTRISDGEYLYCKPPEAGEEPYWLARVLPGVAVYTGARRYAAGLAAWEEFKPFGNGYLLPRGPLREPVSALKAAQILILTRFDPRHQANLLAIQTRFPDKTVLTATIAPVRVTPYPGGHPEAPEAVRHRALMAFAGLARPEVFTETLQNLGVDLKGSQAFPDHHVYTPEEVHNLAVVARARGTEALITTGKDWARLGERWDEDVPLWVLDVEARLSEPERVLTFLER